MWSEGSFNDNENMHLKKRRRNTENSVCPVNIMTQSHVELLHICPPLESEITHFNYLYLWSVCACACEYGNRMVCCHTLIIICSQFPVVVIFHLLWLTPVRVTNFRWGLGCELSRGCGVIVPARGGKTPAPRALRICFIQEQGDRLCLHGRLQKKTVQK